MLRMRIAAVVALSLALAAGVGWLTAEEQRNRLVWDHWDEVVPGTLYRSGQLRTEQLAEAIRRHGLKTIVSFQTHGSDVASERELARKMGVDFLNLPMPGDGFGKEEQFREVLKAVDDPARRPVLVHCARGTCRTGASVALYRFERNGWTIDDVSAEMERQTYREGWLPGYVYNMVDDHPGRDLFEPRVRLDKNLPTSVPEATDVH
ncbi:tyrosine-protein phosphatase [Isosphaeraceae bacterium EP7]